MGSKARRSKLAKENRRFQSSLQTKSQRREDDFMHLHGSTPTIITYKTVLAIAFCISMVSKLFAAIVGIFKKEKK